MFWSVSYSTCVVYTKRIIHLSVGESGGYLSLSMGTHGLRFLRDFFANLRFFQEDLRFSERNGLNVYSV